MLRRWFIGSVTLGMMASVLLAKPGVVTNKQGETFTGDVSEDDSSVSVNGAGGQLTFKKSNIAKVEYTATVDDQYEQRHAKLKADDVKGRIALAGWANDQKRSDLAVKSLEEARAIDPTNKDAARALDAAERQLELDRPPATKPPATPPTPTGNSPAPAATPSTGPAMKNAPVHRLLTNDEVNIIRQKEMTADDAKVKIRFENGVVKKYLSTGGHDAKEFNALPPLEQAMQILSDGDKTLAKDVHVMTDPIGLLEFKQKVYPIISNACVNCHSGNKAGSFSLYTGDSVNTLYTNFYILQTYETSINKIKYLAMDRDVPERSLVLQFGLPASVGVPAHPKVAGWRPRFKSADDPAYMTVSDWLKNSLKVLKPDYGLDVAASGVASPATKPATKPSKQP